MVKFDLVSEYAPAGDQPEAIRKIAEGFVKCGMKAQVLEGVTGSGKTFTMANVIKAVGKPTLVISHNKTLAAQLFGELKTFFPHNAVEYFVSYYDYYQPEAYIPQTDTYIAKDSSINDEIERFRLSATNSLLGRDDVIVVASVSCIYGLGSSDDYTTMAIRIERGATLDRDDLLAKLVEIHYERNDIEPKSGVFRVRGDTVDIFPSYNNNCGVRVEFFGDTIEAVSEFEPLTGKLSRRLETSVISPAKHFVLPREKMLAAFDSIIAEMNDRVREFETAGKLIEAQRIQQRTLYDMEMIKEIGYCQGIENYARHLTGRAPGTPGECLIDFFPDDFLLVIDESHVTVPQVRGMFNGDQARKTSLIEHGFRLPSARDNRPLNFDEFNSKINQVLYLSATPAEYERVISEQVVRQIIRPTGLLDPPVEVRPLAGQIDDVMEEIRACSERGDRTLATTLTKRTAEDLTAYLREAGMRVEYLHSDIETLERVAILSRLRRGEFDALIGINLLREGLDLPEVALVAVLDADKEGFLRSATSLIQTAGRAARHEGGRVILYAERLTDSMRGMIRVTEERRAAQLAFNAEHGITPTGVKRALSEDYAVTSVVGEIEAKVFAEDGVGYDISVAIEEIKAEMLRAAEALEFERAAALRDELNELKKKVGVEKLQPTPATPPKKDIRKTMSEISKKVKKEQKKLKKSS
ncbi:MAG: excinuclease ABC subunit UvrB [Kiritimatiellaeota bacterium]|nr:excinuclease ABC subunit UvrB [Kiritimatiellota bacterium]